MKLTQKTLFQCFEKSRPSSPIINSPTIIHSCESQIKISSEQQKSDKHQSNCLLPIHIRQLNNSLYNDIIPCFNERKFNDDNLSHSSQEFYRICPTIVNNQNHLPKIEFIKISSTERQMELFNQYTNDQSIINWTSMFKDLQDYRKKVIEQNQYEQLLWTEIYRPKNSKTYLGNHTRQIKRLNEWFSYWTKKLHNEQPKKKVLRKKRKRLAYDDDEYFDENFSNDSNRLFDNSCHSKSEYPRLIFIHGFGTTSLVHALAEEYNFKVTEINGSQSRARAPLLKQLEQVTNHHCLSFKRCPSDTIMSQEDKSKSIKEVLSPLPVKKKAKSERDSIISYFNQPKKSVHNNDEQKENNSHNQLKSIVSDKKQSKKLTNETNITKKRNKIKQEEKSMITTDNQFVSSIQVEKTSLILFDEIETLTIDDHFWSCLKKLLETAKKPIILTSNSRINPEDAIINLSKITYYELIHLEQNEPELIGCFLRLILLIEMLEVPSFDDLIKLVKYCSYDLRQTLLTLQFLAQSSTITNIQKCSSEENNFIISQPKWQSSCIFDAMYYSHLGEQWNESLLKKFFDDLTIKYTSEYQKSHLLLINHSKNNIKRIELYDTFKLFMQEQEINNIIDHSSFYLDYRPYIRQICQNEQIRINELNSNRRLRHNLSFRGCSLQWSDFEILSTGID
ncbi:unnamed protein product [Rotaria sordida]|uniref:ATPase AAA-type core domain-containing protein n=1 Tax=Rotaria sordida TaxID=392033 RepID=A0A813VVZ6_9BILA|nr:unnamed protein product [Rotaria sordida]CAF3883492.1 unnamed protein product [Rotaria sordida]